MAAAPERGVANEAVFDLLADALGIERRRLALVAGRTAQDKVVEVEALSPSEIDRRLERAADG